MRRLTRAVLTARVCAALLCGDEAFAAAYQLDARTEVQAYQLRSYRGSDPSNPVLLPRRRIVQYLGLNAFELFTGQDVGFESSLRLFADFGLPRGEAARIDGLRSEEADLLYANVNYHAGGFEARVGRQMYVDVMDWMSFDGLKLRYVTKWKVGAEVYGGLWVKSASFLGSSVFQPDGIRDTDDIRSSQDSVLAEPAYDEVEPLIGIKLLLEEFHGFTASAGYRRAWVGGKVDLERGMLDLRYGTGRGFNVFSGLDWDLFLGRLGQGRLQVRYDAELFAVSAEAFRVQPVFASDSIWYYFSSSPRDELRLRGDYTPPGRFRFYLQGLASLYGATLNSATLVAGASDPSAPSRSSFGGSAGGALGMGRVHSAVDLTYRSGFGGRQLWVDLTGGYAGESKRWTVDGRLSVAQIADGQNPLLRGTFYGGQVWASYLLTPGARISLALEQNFNAFTRSDTKVFVLMDLKALL